MKELTKIYFGERKLVDAGLIAISIIILQAWIAGGTNDPALFISLIALAGCRREAVPPSEMVYC